MMDKKDMIQEIRDLILVEDKVVTFNYVAEHYGMTPSTAQGILNDVREELKVEGRKDDIVSSYVITGYKDDPNASQDEIRVLKIMEVDEDEVDDCKSNFYSDLKSVVIKSIRGRDVPKISTSPYKRRNKRSVVDGGIQDSSDLERRQASYGIIAPEIKLRERFARFTFGSNASQTVSQTSQSSSSKTSSLSTKPDDSLSKSSQVVSSTSSSSGTNSKMFKQKKQNKLGFKKVTKEEKMEQDVKMEKRDEDEEADSGFRSQEPNGHDDEDNFDSDKDDDDMSLTLVVPEKNTKGGDDRKKSDTKKMKGRRVMTLSSDDEEDAPAVDEDDDEEPIVRTKKTRTKTQEKKGNNKKKVPEDETSKKRKRVCVMDSSEDEEKKKSEEDEDDSDEEIVVKRKAKSIKDKKKQKKVISSDSESEKEDEEEMKRMAKMNGRVKVKPGAAINAEVIEEIITETDEDGFTVTRKVKKCVSRNENPANGSVTKSDAIKGLKDKSVKENSEKQKIKADGDDDDDVMIFEPKVKNGSRSDEKINKTAPKKSVTASQDKKKSSSSSSAAVTKKKKEECSSSQQKRITDFFKK